METKNDIQEEEELLDLGRLKHSHDTHMSMIPCDSLQPLPLKLRFINSPSKMIFSASRITAEDGSPITIELVDTISNTRVTSDVPSFSRLEIVPLKAFITEESLTTEEFNRYILRPSEGNPPLLVGDRTVTLKEGVGVIGSDVAFTDDTSREGISRIYRLGAKVTQGGVWRG